MYVKQDPALLDQIYEVDYLQHLYTPEAALGLEVALVITIL